MMEYAKDLKKQVLDAASCVLVDPVDVTNKGNLTTAVLQQVYLPQIEITEEKRKSWGDDGICVFLSLIARGLQNLGVSGLGVDDADEDTYTFSLEWSPYFEQCEDEKSAKVTRIQEEELAGYVTHERAIEEVALTEERADVDQLVKDLKNEPRPSLTENAPPADPVATGEQMQSSGLKSQGGSDSK
jgi:hypothetical protein